MKPQKINKKLSLNKNTVSNLDDIELKRIYGGATDDFGQPTSCVTCYDPSCITCYTACNQWTCNYSNCHGGCIPV